MKEEEQLSSHLAIGSDLQDLLELSFSGSSPKISELDKAAGKELRSVLVPADGHTVYIVAGATPHLLQAAVEASNNGLTVRGWQMGNHLGNPSEQRTVQVALALGIKNPQELRHLFEKPSKERADTALFLLEPTTHNCQRSLRGVYQDLLPLLEGRVNHIVLVQEDLPLQEVHRLVSIASGNKLPEQFSHDTLANWCHEYGVSLHVSAFYKGRVQSWQPQ